MCEVISGEQRALLQKGRKPETRLKLKEFVACQTVANFKLGTLAFQRCLYSDWPAMQTNS